VIQTLLCVHRGKVIASELDEKLTEFKARGCLPFFVSTTAGTTVFGAFDPIEDVADVCQKHEVWLHVDVSSTSYTVLLYSESIFMFQQYSVKLNTETKQPHALWQCDVSDLIYLP
jgi:glutamate/tyrosine decarboxylase-like PLP-dependent enzyme